MSNDTDILTEQLSNTEGAGSEGAGFLFSSDHLSIIFSFVGWNNVAANQQYLISKEASIPFQRVVEKILSMKLFYHHPTWNPKECYNYAKSPQQPSRIQVPSDTNPVIEWEDGWRVLKQGLHHQINISLYRHKLKLLNLLEPALALNIDQV